MSSANPDVVVVGAGPVGLVVAAELARRGVAVRIFDKLAAPTPESRAIAVHSRSLEMLSRMGIVDQLIDTGVKTGGMQLYAGHEELFRVPLDGVDSAYPFSLVTAQTETERVLGEHLVAQGVTVERGIELTALTQYDDAVRVTLQNADGRVEEVTASWVVGADGGHSTTRHLVGTKLQGSFEGERFYLGDVDAEHDLDLNSMHTFFSPDGPVMVFPMRGGRTRVMAQIHDDPGTPINRNPSMADLQEIIDQRVGTIKLVHPHWMTTFEIHHALVPAYRWGRALLVGDACHIHSPAGGQGMNTGMQDGFNLAWKLAAVVKGEGGDALLDTYQSERYPIAEQVITFSDRLTKAGTLTGVPQRVRNVAIRTLSHIEPARRYLARTAAEVDVNYRKSPLALGNPPRGAKVAAGDYLPHVEDLDIQKQLSEIGRGLGHTVVTVAPGPVPPVAGVPARQILVTSGAADPSYDAVVSDPGNLVAHRLGLHDGGRIVVRPDGYLGVVTALDDSATVAEYFTVLAG